MTTYPYDGPKIVSATGHAIVIDSISEVFVTIGSIIVKHKAILVLGIAQDCVLGMDFLRKDSQ